MMTGKTARILTMALVLVWFVTPGAAHASQEAVEFSADLVITGPDSTSNAKLYVRGSNIHRVEMSKETGGMIFLRPPEARGKIWMLDPGKNSTAYYPGRKHTGILWKPGQTSNMTWVAVPRAKKR